jgi:hypothetical protein
VSAKTWLKTFAPNVEHNSNTGSDEYKSECCKSHAECNNYGRDVAHGCSPTAVSSVLSLTLHNKTSHVSGNCADLIFSASSLPCHKLISSLSFRLVWLHNNGCSRSAHLSRNIGPCAADESRRCLGADAHFHSNFATLFAP